MLVYETVSATECYTTNLSLSPPTIFLGVKMSATLLDKTVRV